MPICSLHAHRYNEQDDVLRYVYAMIKITEMDEDGLENGKNRIKEQNEEEKRKKTVNS